MFKIVWELICVVDRLLLMGQESVIFLVSFPWFAEAECLVLVYLFAMLTS